MDNNNWHWQEKGMAWYGIGIYHVTLVVPSREPLLGKLIIQENDPKQAIVERTNLGNALVEKLQSHPSYYPEIRILQFCLMPDHLHATCMLHSRWTPVYVPLCAAFGKEQRNLAKHILCPLFPNQIRVQTTKNTGMKGK